MKVTAREKELTTSEKRKTYRLIEINIENQNMIKVMWKGFEVGRLILKFNNLEFNPNEGFDINLDITNITPLKDKW